MISIGKLGLGHAEYYLTEVVEGREDYYLVAAESPGQWSGALAGRLGLAGVVTKDDLRAVFEGHDPETGTRLRTSQVKQVAFDFTLSVPKSVTLLWALGDDRTAAEVVAAVEAANRQALAMLEDVACGVRRGHAGVNAHRGGGFVVASFRHGTSRDRDPHLHVHNLVANLTVGPDGRWSGIDSGLVYQWAAAVSHTFECLVRDELTRRLRVGFAPHDGTGFEVDGIPARVRKAFSRRTQKISAEMERKGLSSARAAQVANLQTRKAKDRHLDEDQLRHEWRQRADDLNFTVARVPRARGTTARATVGTTALTSVGTSARTSIGTTARTTVRTTDHTVVGAMCTAEHATFRRPAVYAAVCRQFRNGASMEVIESCVESFLAGPAVVALGDTGWWTTPEMLELESRAVALASETRPDARTTATREATARAIDERPSLSDEQAEMVWTICTSRRRYETVIGQAGTGKTFTLDAGRQAWEASGCRVIGAAPSAKAARGLQEGSAIRSTSVAKLLCDLDEGRQRIDDRTVVVVDEAGMLETRRLAALLDAVVAGGGRMVAIGDHKQLAPVGAGGVFVAIARRCGYVQLTENRRQVDPEQRMTLALLRAGQVDRAIERMSQDGQIVTGHNADQLRDAMVGDWFAELEAGVDVVMMARTRHDVADLNERARDLRIAVGELDDTVMVVDDLEFAVDDRVVAHRNRYDLGILNADRGTVVGRRGERLLVDVDVAGEAPRRVALPPDYVAAGHLTHGYATTVHKSQGITCDVALTLADDGFYAELGYTAATRGRHDNRLYVLASERADDHGLDVRRPEPHDQVLHALRRSRAKTAAIDVKGSGLGL